MMKDPKNANMAKSIFALAKETYHPATKKAVGEVVK
jgi:hypothetical protein